MAESSDEVFWLRLGRAMLQVGRGTAAFFLSRYRLISSMSNKHSVRRLMELRLFEVACVLAATLYLFGARANKFSVITLIRLNEHSTNSLFNLYGFHYPISCVKGVKIMVVLAIVNTLLLLIGFLPVLGKKSPTTK